MMLVRDILRGKPGQVWRIGPQSTVYEALQMMADRDIGALPVVEGGQLIGMFSERDYARKVVLQGRSSQTTTVGELMSHPVYWVGPAETIETCMVTMTNRRIRHLPVLEDGRLIGLVSIGDILKAMITDQRMLIDDLEHYITSTPR
jgi:CBS domain-containing protein